MYGHSTLTLAATAVRTTIFSTTMNRFNARKVK